MRQYKVYTFGMIGCHPWGGGGDDCTPAYHPRSVGGGLLYTCMSSLGGDYTPACHHWGGGGGGGGGGGIIHLHVIPGGGLYTCMYSYIYWVFAKEHNALNSLIGLST